MKTVYLLTTGDGSDGNEWIVHGVYSSAERAQNAKREYERPRERPDGTTYYYGADIEEWEVDPK